MWVQSLDWEEKGMATCSSILPWRISRTEDPGWLWSMGHTESDMTEELSTAQHKVLLVLEAFRSQRVIMK